MMHFIEELPKAKRKEYRNTLRNELIAAGGGIFINRYLRMVIAIEPCIPGNNCESFSVAIAYCNPNDKFRKSVGEAIALYRLNSDMCNVIRCEIRGGSVARMDKIASDFFDN